MSNMTKTLQHCPKCWPGDRSAEMQQRVFGKYDPNPCNNTAQSIALVLKKCFGERYGKRESKLSPKIQKNYPKLWLLEVNEIVVRVSIAFSILKSCEVFTVTQGLRIPQDSSENPSAAHPTPPMMITGRCLRVWLRRCSGRIRVGSGGRRSWRRPRRTRREHPRRARRGLPHLRRGAGVRFPV